ncbi:MAG TPA: hypothetical protein VEJ38_11080 [Candidatus Acidoferrales bacterium]|nr:hypothetical protein [Candidatus Acidoferrales bacterium]
MERRVSVNGKATSGPLEVRSNPRSEAWADQELLETQGFPSGGSSSDAEPRPSGPCLYFGPAGERCSRPALAGGFCAKHQPGGRMEALKNPARILAAALGIVALIWPYVNDLVREILRWAHER